MSGTPQTDGWRTVLVPCEAAFETSPTIAEVPLLACPPGMKLRLKRIGIFFHTLPTDGSAAVAADIEWVDKSNSDTVTNLAAAVNFLAANTDMVARNWSKVWQGSQDLDPGDTVNAEMDVATPDVAGAGACFMVEFEVLENMNS